MAAVPLIHRLAAFAPRRIIGLLRETNDLQTSAGRSRERHRLVILAGLTAALVRGVSILTALITIPLTLGYLGAERFGMWATLSSFNALLSFADFGVGNGVMTAVATRSGRGNAADLRRTISTAYIALCGVAALMLFALWASQPWVSWPAVFAVSSPMALREAAPAAQAFLALMALANPIGVIIRVQEGLQQQWRANLWLLAGNIAALAAVLVAIQLQAGLLWLVLALVGTPLLLQLANTIEYVWRTRPDLRPQLSSFDKGILRQLAATGFLFMILQLCAAIIFQSNNLIIAQVLGAAAVTSFAVPDRLFGIVPMILGFILSPLWPAYGEAAARGDHAWVRRTFRRSMLLTLASATALSGALLLAAPLLLRWWVGSEFHAPFALLAALALWRVVEAAGQASAMLLNGMNQLAIQVFAAVVSAAAIIGLRIWLVDSIGVAGAALGGIVVYMAFTIPLLAFAIHRLFAAPTRAVP